MKKELTKLKGDEAFSNETGLNFDVTPILTSDEKGAPNKRIDVEALDNSARAFWRFHEKELWGVLIGCCAYFLVVLI